MAQARQDIAQHSKHKTPNAARSKQYALLIPPPDATCEEKGEKTIFRLVGYSAEPVPSLPRLLPACEQAARAKPAQGAAASKERGSIKTTTKAKKKGESKQGHGSASVEYIRRVVWGAGQPRLGISSVAPALATEERENIQDVTSVVKGSREGLLFMTERTSRVKRVWRRHSWRLRQDGVFVERGGWYSPWCLQHVRQTVAGSCTFAVQRTRPLTEVVQWDRAAADALPPVNRRRRVRSSRRSRIGAWRRQAK